ncbi:MAG TPA: hypothetical protein VHE99_02630 [Gammaproteobacteria bacterium]|nr:hypothetical protein [Gammaproteobacteria bacterium]
MQQLLKKMIGEPQQLARFLNTLSLLEYIGARKIIKSLQQQQLNEKLLGHMNEELRHALILKRAAVKISPQCDDYATWNLLCGDEAWHYFQTVDHAAITLLQETDPWRCYVFTTLLLELRAVEFYTIFEQSLQELGKPSIFRGILHEENRHLQEMLAWIRLIPDSNAKLAQLQEMEAAEFSAFMGSVAVILKVSEG